MKAFSQAGFCAPQAAPADLPPPGAARNRLRRALERRQVERDQRPHRPAGARPHQQDARAAPRPSISTAWAKTARLVDLPATAMRACRRRCATQWGELVGGYLQIARTLVGVVVVMDARHPLTPLDRQLLRLARRRAAARALTKADKLSRDEQAKRRLQCDAESLRDEVHAFFERHEAGRRGVPRPARAMARSRPRE